MTRLLAALLLALTCTACQTEAHHMNQPRIEKLFEKTKPVCFGRFVVDVPISTQVQQGWQTFNGSIESLPNNRKELRASVAKRISQLKAVKHEEVPGTLLRDSYDGPTTGSKTILSWSSPSATYVTVIQGFLDAPPHGFLYKSGAGVSEGPSLDNEKANLTYVATHLRARDPSEVPTEPGVCLDVGFIADDTGKFQEIFGIGFRFPELPDASFSISSNKNAQQGDPFEDRVAQAARAARSVPEMAAALARVKTLRQGHHKVQQGEGSEALFRRPASEGPGYWHEFQFEYRGTRFDHHNPPWDATLFTGVERSDAGAVPTALTDDEAIALWDKLMASVRLRVPAKQ